MASHYKSSKTLGRDHSKEGPGPSKFKVNKISLVSKFKKDEVIIKDSEISSNRERINQMNSEWDFHGYDSNEKVFEEEKTKKENPIIPPSPELGHSELELVDGPNLRKTPSNSDSFEGKDWNFDGDFRPGKTLQDNTPSTKIGSINRRSDSTKVKAAILKRSDSSLNFLKELKERLLLRNTIAGISTAEVIRYTFWPFCLGESRVSKAVDMTYDMIESKFDMTRLLKTMQDLDKWLRLAMTDDQRRLFDLIPSGLVANKAEARPHTYSVNGQDEQQAEDSKIEELKLARNALVQICESSHPSVLEENLLDHLGFLLKLELNN
jgi:hypothetical protein